MYTIINLKKFKLSWLDKRSQTFLMKESFILLVSIPPSCWRFNMTYQFVPPHRCICSRTAKQKLSLLLKSSFCSKFFFCVGRNVLIAYLTRILRLQFCFAAWYKWFGLFIYDPGKAIRDITRIMYSDCNWITRLHFLITVDCVRWCKCNPCNYFRNCMLLDFLAWLP